MKSTLFFCFFLSVVSSLAQSTKLELGMRRNTVQTVMGRAKIDLYQSDKTVYAFHDSVFCTIDFDGNEQCKGFYWWAQNDTVLTKTIQENGFLIRDSITFYAKDFSGVLKKDANTKTPVYRFIAAPPDTLTQVKKPLTLTEQAPKEKPFYGFTILGAKVWKKKEK